MELKDLREFRVEYFNKSITIALGKRGVIVVGDSAMGKTYLVNILKNLQQNATYVRQSSFPIKNVEIWEAKKDIDLNITGTLIIIDRFSIIKSDELINFINTSDNKFVIISHDYKFNRPNGFIEILIWYDTNTGNFSSELAQLSDFYRITPVEDVVDALGWKP